MAPMKGMIFGWFNPFHTIACLQSLYAPTHVLQYARRDVPTQNTNFLSCIARLLGDPRVFDTYSDPTVRALPYVGKTTGGNRVTTDLSEIAGT